jgi:polyhydroxyalkanoate synthesis regulator phasin
MFKEDPTVNRHFLLPLSLSFGIYLIASSAYGKTDMVSCEYKYTLGDNDTKHDARKIAFIEAKRRCAEQIGTLLASETVVSSSDLTKDEIRAYSLSFMKTEQVAESFLPSGDGLAVFVKLNARYDSDLMSARLKELLSDRGKSQEFKNAQGQIVALEKQVVNLQRQLGGTVPDEQIIQLREERNAVLSQYDTIVRNLENLNSKTQRYARCGMTMNEVQFVLGPPRGVNAIYKSTGTETWNYGEKWLKFEGGVVVAISEDSSPFQREGVGCKAK